jgi:hypothetical protein
MQQPAEHSDGCRLTCAIRAEEPEDFSCTRLEADVVHGAEVAEAFHEILNLH